MEKSTTFNLKVYFLFNEEVLLPFKFSRGYIFKKKQKKHHLPQKQPSKKTRIIIVDYNESKGIHSVTFQQDIQCSENTNIFDIFC